MRIFIGIALEERVKRLALDVQKSLEPFVIKGHFSPPELQHLTLLFIGEMTMLQVVDLHQHLQIALEDVKRFSLGTNGLDSFKKGENHVLFLGIRNAESRLLDLVEKVKDATRASKINFVDTRFVPHITLGRKIVFKDEFNLRQFITMETEFNVELVHLYLSQRIDDELRYIPLHTYRLK